jgi:cellulose synthase/poly-beta-1,6-N-acetylglucosamine synthase-like glycosyltransferase
MTADEVRGAPRSLPPPARTVATAPGQLDENDRLDWAVNGLRRVSPDGSAFFVTTRAQKVVLAGLVAGIPIGLYVAPHWTGVALMGTVLVAYVCTIVNRMMLTAHAFRDEGSVRITDDEARRYPDDALPRYSVLVPCYREPSVIGQLVGALGRLEYPADKLEILVVLEADDADTIAAARDVIVGDNIRIVEVPPAEPRTKPKALNYALTECCGEIVAVYDAEDLPEPLQLRRAAIGLAAGGPRLACLQAQLNYFNPEQNLLTRWFTIEYTSWFTQLLPGLVAVGAPVPLGGTSNHFRKDVLLEVGGWDPYNVTEDADLGLRLHREEYRVGVLESVTLEEANSDFVNWVKQRSRWYKGYLQTWLINMRHPRQTLRRLGPRGFFVFNAFVGGTPFLALVNPIMWFLTMLWFLLEPAFIHTILPTPLFFAGLFCWVIGNFLLLYGFVLTAVSRDDVHLLKAALLLPLYFVMMSLAAYKALVQLVAQPSYWEKTTHGLAGAAQPGAAT